MKFRVVTTQALDSLCPVCTCAHLDVNNQSAVNHDLWGIQVNGYHETEFAIIIYTFIAIIRVEAWELTI